MTWLHCRCTETTQSDYVEFSNFNIKLKDRKMYRFCGTEEENQKKTVHSDGNFFRVTFKSNDIYDATGFEAFYQFMKQEEGEGMLLLSVGLRCILDV